MPFSDIDLQLFVTFDEGNVLFKGRNGLLDSDVMLENFSYFSF